MGKERKGKKVMSNVHINIELPERLRRKFKLKCKKQNITVQKAVPLLLQKVVDGKISFTPVERDVLVFNKKGKSNG